MTAILLSASERTCVRQDTDKPFDAHSSSELNGVADTAGEVRAGARTDTHHPAQPRAAPPPGPTLESYYFFLTLFVCSLCGRRSLSACG